MLLLVSLVIVVVNDAVVVGARGLVDVGRMFELYASVGMMCAAGATGGSAGSIADERWSFIGESNDSTQLTG